MAGILTFDKNEVAKLVTHAKAAKNHSPSYEDLFNAAYHRGGVVKEINGWPDRGNIDDALIPAALHLVKDQGVYLMSNGIPILPRGNGKPGSEVAYAREASPTVMEFDDWYENAARIMGGDDSVTTLPVEMFGEELRKAAPVIRLKVTSRAIALLPSK